MRARSQWNRGLTFGLMLVSSWCAAADIVKGAQVYGLHCVTCHGRNGVSVMPAAPNLARGEGLMQPDIMLLDSIRRGKGAMPAYLGILNDREVLDVIAFMRTLRQ